MTLQSAITQSRGVLSTSEYRSLRNSISRACARGELIRVLPGVVVAAEGLQDPLTLIRAARQWNPSCVLVGATAARLSYWPGAPAGVVDLAVEGEPPSSPYYRMVRRSLPLELIDRRLGIGVSSAEVTALDLFASGVPVGLYEALRTRSVTQLSLHRACGLLKGSPGSASRRAALRVAAANPWSVPEAQLHEILRTAHLTGWVGNHRVVLNGVTYYLDVGFPRQRLAIEVDGYAVHGDRSAFEHDRERQAHLMAHGWRVLRLTSRMIERDPDAVIVTIRRALRVTWASR